MHSSRDALMAQDEQHPLLALQLLLRVQGPQSTEGSLQHTPLPTLATRNVSPL